MDETRQELLKSILENNAEDLHIEYKSWLDLSQKENKAKIAKHICGLSNYGGGYIVFGINDNGTFCDPHPENIDGYRQDIINNICSTYLHPDPHCRVDYVKASNGRAYPVVSVPPHGAQPICAKKGGPLVKGQPIGIQMGTHYTRSSGPKTVPIDSPDRWQKIISRCILSERNRLLAAISGLLDEPELKNESSVLEQLSLELDKAWKSEVTDLTWVVDLGNNHSKYCFELLNIDYEPVHIIELHELREAVHTASFSADQRVEVEISAFDQLRDRSKRSIGLFRDIEGYQIEDIAQNGDPGFIPLLGQIYPFGIGGEIRSFWEDNGWVQGAVEGRGTKKWPPG